MPNVVDAIREKMAKVTDSVEAHVQADVIGVFGPIVTGVEHRVRAAIEALTSRRNRAVGVLVTGCGSFGVTERIVNVLRHCYGEVVFLIPDVALGGNDSRDVRR